MKVQRWITVFIISVILLFLNCDILVAQKPFLEKDFGEKYSKITYEACDGEIVFNFIEPEIPQLYILSCLTEFTHEEIEIIEEKFLNDYCKRFPELQSLKDHYHKDGSWISYNNKNACIDYSLNTRYMQFFKIKESDYWGDNPDNNLNQDVKTLLHSGEKFINEALFIGNKELKGEVSSKKNEIFFKQYFEGVMIGGAPYGTEDGIYLRLIGDQVIGFSYCIHDLNKVRSVSKLELLTPLEAIKKVEKVLSKYYSYRRYKFNKVNIVYVDKNRKGLMLPTWEFIDVEQSRKLYINAISGRFLFLR